MSETHGYTSPSNARRAARQAGYELDQVDIVQDGARFFYQPKSGAVVTEGAEHSEVVAEGQAVAETGGVTDPDDEIAGDADHVLPTVAAPVLTGLDRLHELDGNSVVMLIGIDGADYGMAKVCEVVNTAANLAGSEGIAIKIVVRPMATRCTSSCRKALRPRQRRLRATRPTPRLAPRLRSRPR
jgi:hypothetical protein